MLLLLLLSRFSRVRLCATPETTAHQAPPSLGFSRQEHWSGLSLSSPMHESESEVTQSSPTPSHHMDCSLPGPSIHGIFQARDLEWGAIATPPPLPYLEESTYQRSHDSESLKFSFLMAYAFLSCHELLNFCSFVRQN